MAQRIASAGAAPMVTGGGEMTLSASIGIAFRPAESTDSAEDLLRDAAVAMHQAKEQGRDRIAAFDIAARQAAVERHETLTALRRSIGNDQLVVDTGSCRSLALGEPRRTATVSRKTRVPPPTS